jgi:RND family efflux transporter MFP subunit
MAETAEELREKLGTLRLERAPVRPQRGPRRWVVAAVAAAIVLTLLLGYRLLAPGPVPVEVARASVPDSGTPDAVAVVSGAGYVVSADRYVAIGVRVAGRIDRYFVVEGDRVEPGQPLVQLDPRDYEAAVQRAEAALAVARATAALKAQQFTRARKLSGSGVISREELDLRVAEANASAATVQQAEAELASARVSLDYTTLRAPRRGVILAKFKEVGEIAVPGGFSGSGDLIRMANLEDLRGQVDITESDLAKVHLGQRAAVIPDAYPDKHYEAVVAKLYPQVDRQKGTLRVEVRIEEPDDALWPDMSIRITFLEALEPTPGRTPVLVPRRAVQGAGAEPFAWVVVGEHVRRTPLTLGRDFGDQVQVTSGLAGNETVVVSERGALRDGQAVAVTGGT